MAVPLILVAVEVLYSANRTITTINSTLNLLRTEQCLHCTGVDKTNLLCNMYGDAPFLVRLLFPSGCEPVRRSLRRASPRPG